MKATETDKKVIEQCLDRYYLRSPRRLPNVPLDMRMVPYDNSDWTEWKMIPSTVTSEDLFHLEEKLPARLPPFFLAFLTTRCVLMGQEVGDYFLPGLPSDQPLQQVERFLLNEELWNAGYLQFAQNIHADPVCFDFKLPTAEGDYPIVVFNHNWVEPNAWHERETLEPLAEVVAGSFRQFFMNLFRKV